MKCSVFLLFASLVAVASALNLPTYIKPCKKADPEFVKCAVERGNEIISRLTEGDSTYGIPVMDPLKDDEIQHFIHPHINVTISEIVVHGLKNSKLVSYARTDTLIDSTAFVKHLEVICDYALAGLLLEHKIDGSGKVEMQFYNVTLPIHVHLTKSKKEGYASVQNVTAQVVPEKVHFNTTQFNGDLKTLKLAEQAANKDSKKMMAILSPILDKLLTTAIKKTASAFFDNIAVNLIFP